MSQQDFKLSLRMIQKKIEKYSKLSLEKKESNLFLLKTSVSDIILLLNYFLLKKGNKIGLEVKPNFLVSIGLRNLCLLVDQKVE